MKKKIIFVMSTLLLSAMITVNVSLDNKKGNMSRISLSSLAKIAYADGEGGSYSCTVTAYCFNLLGTKTGEVSCTGLVCEKGIQEVTCDGNTTEC